MYVEIYVCMYVAADMKTIDDVEPEIDIDDIDEDWERDRQEDEEEGRQGRGSTAFGQVRFFFFNFNTFSLFLKEKGNGTADRLYISAVPLPWGRRDFFSFLVFINLLICLFTFCSSVF